MNLKQLNTYISQATKLQQKLETKESKLKEWEDDRVAREKRLVSDRTALKANLNELVYNNII